MVLLSGFKVAAFPRMTQSFPSSTHVPSLAAAALNGRRSEEWRRSSVPATVEAALLAPSHRPSAGVPVGLAAGFPGDRQLQSLRLSPLPVDSPIASWLTLPHPLGAEGVGGYPTASSSSPPSPPPPGSQRVPAPPCLRRYLRPQSEAEPASSHQPGVSSWKQSPTDARESWLQDVK